MRDSTTTTQARSGSVVFPDAWVDEWVRAAQRTPEVQVVGRWARVTVVLRCGEEQVAVAFDRGRMRRLWSGADGAGAETEAVVFAGSAAAWDSLLTPAPAPGCNDVLALDRLHPEFDVPVGRESLIRHLRLILLLMGVAARTERKLDDQR